MFTFLSTKKMGGGIALAAIALSSLYGCSKHEAQEISPSNAVPLTSPTAQSDTTGTTVWTSFLSQVAAGLIKDPKGQYVSKSTYVPSDGKSARPTRPKGDDTKRTLASLFATKGYAGRIPADDGGGGGGGAPVPNYTHFSSTEMVQSWDVPPALMTPGQTPKQQATASQRPNSFYSTENPNGYLYDLKIVKGSSANQAPFDGNPHYHNIPIDLNEGAGGEYIYVSFTRDPLSVEYQTHPAGCGYNGSGGDETPRDANGNTVNMPIMDIDTEVRCCNAPWSNCHGVFTPMYARQSPVFNSNYFKFPDLNDGAGGSYIYAWQTRVPNTVNRPIEVGVITGNSLNITPPAGWVKVGSDLNNGAGGAYIFFCIKYR
ncbi:MAG: hypothetical protein M3Y54_01170 [Bacteroidota bacterium]|nr:hypothetical protein [Bacteroidota bacterium]